MTDQPDLKARLLTLDAFTITDGAGANVALDLIEQAVSRITHLEAERDRLWRLPEFEQDDEGEITMRCYSADGQQAVAHVFREGHILKVESRLGGGNSSDRQEHRVPTPAEARAQAAESRLALADRIAEAGRVFQRYIAAWDAKPMSGMDDTIHGIHVGTEWQAEIRRSDLRALSAALTAYEENTSSNDLTTGEDDA